MSASPPPPCHHVLAASGGEAGWFMSGSWVYSVPYVWVSDWTPPNEFSEYIIIKLWYTTQHLSLIRAFFCYNNLPHCVAFWVLLYFYNHLIWTWMSVSPKIGVVSLPPQIIPCFIGFWTIINHHPTPRSSLWSTRPPGGDVPLGLMVGK